MLVLPRFLAMAVRAQTAGIHHVLCVDRFVRAVTGILAFTSPGEARGRLRAAGAGAARNEGARRRQVDTNIHDAAVGRVCGWLCVRLLTTVLPRRGVLGAALLRHLQTEDAIKTATSFG